MIFRFKMIRDLKNTCDRKLQVQIFGSLIFDGIYLFVSIKRINLDVQLYEYKYWSYPSLHP